MKILVTGATGHLGAMDMEHFLAQGSALRPLDPAFRENIKAMAVPV